MFIATVSSSFQSNAYADACGLVVGLAGCIGRSHASSYALASRDLLLKCCGWMLLIGLDDVGRLPNGWLLKLPKIDPKNAIPQVFCNFFHTQISGRYLAQRCHGLHNGFAL
jgi:hypothetical protein